MRYGNVLSSFSSTPWHITESALHTMMEILAARSNGLKFSEDEIRQRIQASGTDHRRAPMASQGGVGILPLYGPIFPKANMFTEFSGATSLEQFRSDLRALANNDRVGTIVLDIDSPGGSSMMLAETAEEMRQIRQVKPIVSVCNGEACSAAYYLAAQGTEIAATPSALVGNIGTYMVHEDWSKHNEKEGIKPTYIYSGKYKVDGNPDEPLSDRAKDYIQGMVDHFQEMFVQNVALGRGVSPQQVATGYGEGKALVPVDALEMGLVDRIATLDDVVGELLDNGGNVSTATSYAAAMGRMAQQHFHLDAESTRKFLQEVADKEHSDPGTGLGGEPQPREQVPPVEKDAKEGWRRDTPPIAKEGSVMDRKKLLAFANRLGVEITDDMSDEDIAAACDSSLIAVMDEITPLREAQARAREKQTFAEQFPEEFSRMQKLEERDRQANAKEFAGNYSRFAATKDDDGKTVEFSTRGFSSVVLEKIENAHLKISEGEFGHTELADILDSVASGNAVVDYGERGSSRIHEDDLHGSLTGDDAVTAFAEKVAEYQTQDNISYREAVALASSNHPKLFEEYNKTMRSRGRA